MKKVIREDKERERMKEKRKNTTFFKFYQKYHIFIFLHKNSR